MAEQAFSLLDQPSKSEFLDVLGPLVQPLTDLSGGDEDYSLFRSIFPHGIVVPLHSHADRETFYILDGKLEGLTPQGWRSFGPGEVFNVPGNARHAWRNFSGSPVSLLFVTTMRMGRFFGELGRPAATVPPGPPRPEELQRFAALSRDYGYWLGSPEDNEAVGLVFG